MRVAGTVEGYRERVFRSGGKLAFFVLEDLSGGIEVKARERVLGRFGEIITSGEPVLILGKLQFPMVEDETDAEQEPTLLLDEAMLLSEAIAAETRAVAIRLPAAQLAGKQMLAKLAGVLRASPGSCPVQLVIETEEGAEAFLSLGPTRVAPSDALLSALERMFGRTVAELR